MRTRVGSTLILLFGTNLIAQQRPIFDPDDFVDPRQHAGPVFISRLILGAALNPSDDYRPLHQNTGFVSLTNSFFWKNVQFDYKHSEERGADHNGDVVLTKCGCQPPLYFPTAPPPGATPLAPLPGSKDTLQAAWYHSVKGRDAEPRVMLRYRLTLTRQEIGTEIQSQTGQTLSRMSGREQSVGVDADTYFHVGAHDIYGSVAFARTARTGTNDDRRQSELTYTGRFPAIAAGKILLRSTLTVGGVSNRGVTGLNVVNPMFEAFLHDWRTRANFHLIWSPQATRSRDRGWETQQQVAFFVDRALYVHLFRPR
jgi:hypothetical protein